MKVGDYVRFYNRSWTEIGQITGEVEDSHLKVVKCRDGYYDLDGFIKSSSNIIDLIKEGDYVNGEIVTKVVLDEIECKYIELDFSYNKRGIREKDIKSIVTKEQFESMEYKIGE